MHKKVVSFKLPNCDPPNSCAIKFSSACLGPNGKQSNPDKGKQRLSLSHYANGAILERKKPGLGPKRRVVRSARSLMRSKIQQISPCFADQHFLVFFLLSLLCGPSIDNFVCRIFCCNLCLILICCIFVLPKLYLFLMLYVFSQSFIYFPKLFSFPKLYSFFMLYVFSKVLFIFQSCIYFIKLLSFPKLYLFSKVVFLSQNCIYFLKLYLFSKVVFFSVFIFQSCIYFQNFIYFPKFFECLRYAILFFGID